MIEELEATYRKPVMNMAVTPIFFWNDSCSFQITGRGGRRRPKSLIILPTP